MANWSTGFLTITGEANAVAFLLNLICLESNERVFPDLRILITKPEAIQRVVCMNDVCLMALPVKYRTSIRSCLLSDACWDDDGNFFGRLSDICRCNHVSIAAEGTEFLGGFSESMNCNTLGEIVYEFRETEIAECPACGEQQLVDKSVDIRALSCPRCNQKGMRSWRDV